MERDLGSRVTLSEQLLMKLDVLAVSVPTPSCSERLVAPRYLAFELQVLIVLKTPVQNMILINIMHYFKVV